MKPIAALFILSYSSALAMTPPQTVQLKVGQTVQISARDTLLLEGQSLQWKAGQSSLCPNVTDPASPINCVRMGSLELIFTTKNKSKPSSFTLIYGDGQVLERKMGAYRLKVLGIHFPPPAQKDVTCPPEVTLKVTLEKAGL